MPEEVLTKKMTFGRWENGLCGYMENNKSHTYQHCHAFHIVYSSREGDGIENKAEYGFDLVIHCFLCFLITHFF